MKGLQSVDEGVKSEAKRSHHEQFLSRMRIHEAAPKVPLGRRAESAIQGCRNTSLAPGNYW